MNQVMAYPLTQREVSLFMLRRFHHGHEVDLSTVQQIGVWEGVRKLEARCRKCDVWVLAVGGGNRCSGA